MVEPEAAFEHIVTRASAVIVGVCCLSLVTVLFSRRTVSGGCASVSSRSARRRWRWSLRGMPVRLTGELERRRRTLAGEVYAVDDLLGVGRAESRALSAALPAIRGGSGGAVFHADGVPLRRRDALGPVLGGARTGAADGRRPAPAGRPTGARRARLRRRRATARELARSPGGDSARTSDRPSGCLSRRAVHGASRRATG
ncbi:FUSC family protein [Pseudomonas aeruginosa]|nr:FUSC family protein [Pseudomonas aeruginosa]